MIAIVGVALGLSVFANLVHLWRFIRERRDARLRARVLDVLRGEPLRMQARAWGVDPRA